MLIRSYLLLGNRPKILRVLYYIVSIIAKYYEQFLCWFFCHFFVGSYCKRKYFEQHVSNIYVGTSILRIAICLLHYQLHICGILTLINVQTFRFLQWSTGLLLINSENLLRVFYSIVSFIRK